MNTDEGRVRLNKRLADMGMATRREADELISRGLVYVNEMKAVLGMKVLPSDTVEVRTGKRTATKERLYVAYNKPRGVITHSPQEGEEDIASSLPAEFRNKGLFPVGRLDKDSYGLIILTNDGRITDRLLNPDAVHEKEYAVRTKFPLRRNFKERMEGGVDIEGYMTKPAKIRVTGEHSFSITLTEGKKHQIRRMVVALFNEVTELKRSRVMNIQLDALKPGKARIIEGKELKDFLVGLGLGVH